jgi:uncharacterized protein (DUF952 family)
MAIAHMLRRSHERVKADACSRGKNHAIPLDQGSGTGHHQSMEIYKILRADEWSALRSQKETSGAPIDVADGFIHFSTSAQVAQTAAKHFAGADNLMLLSMNPDTLGPALKWEKSRGGADFPHLYGPLKLSDVEWAQPLPLINGRHDFPAGLL